MRRALLLVIVVFLGYAVQAHKAIEDEDAADIPEELLDSGEAAKRELTNAEKAKLDPNFFEGLDSIQPAVKKDAMYFIQTYKIEGVAMLFFVFCFIVLFVGKGQNYALAQVWHQRSLPMIKENFTYVGMDDGVDNFEME